MKIAIHHQSPTSFSARWIEYCKINNIPFIIVNCYDDDIMHQIKHCDVVMWHFHQVTIKDLLFAKQFMYSLELAGKKVFPNFRTCWHFDDKVGQKYLLESINAPFVKTSVFYDKISAIKWIDNVSLPKVFKLRGGAGSANVILIKSKRTAIKIIKKAFGNGISGHPYSKRLKENLSKLAKERNIIYLKECIAGIYNIIFPAKNKYGIEKGYVYFQEFIPNNKFDIRVIVIGQNAFALKRLVRENDFRASGSGRIVYDKDEIDINCLKIAFEVNKNIKSQCIAYDFVFDKDNNPLIVEISFGFSMNAYDNCPGYWDSNLNFYEGKFNPQFWIIENLIENLE